MNQSYFSTVVFNLLFVWFLIYFSSLIRISRSGSDDPASKQAEVLVFSFVQFPSSERIVSIYKTLKNEASDVLVYTANHNDHALYEQWIIKFNIWIMSLSKLPNLCVYLVETLKEFPTERIDLHYHLCIESIVLVMNEPQTNRLTHSEIEVPSHVALMFVRGNLTKFQTQELKNASNRLKNAFYTCKPPPKPKVQYPLGNRFGKIK